jgi:sialate O-acetylesterase
MVIAFDHATGLKSTGDALKGFAIAGDDQKFVWADAKIDGDKVIVWSDQVKEPAAVRYAWASNTIGNLRNAGDIPASTFRTDDWAD